MRLPATSLSIRLSFYRFFGADCLFRLVLFLGLVATSLLAEAQNFAPVSGTPFEGVSASSVVFLDFNKDSYPDVLITGSNSAGNAIAKLYVNTGSDGFSEVTGTPFEGVAVGSVAVADVNKDTYPDVLITGYTTPPTSIAKLYLNNGSGGFTEMMGTPFDGVAGGAVAFADVDQDTYPDVLITGGNSAGEVIAKLYRNNGSGGGFTEVVGTPFDGVASSSASFADFNQDTYPDVLITGANNAGDFIAKVYLNNGAVGGFAEVTGTPFLGVVTGSVAIADVNRDTYPDVLITGASTSGSIARLYLNNGSAGGFTEAMGTPFDGVQASAAAFADVDRDAYPDVLITGFTNAARGSANLYRNNGSGGGFTLVTDTPFDGVINGSVAFADIDKDTYPDVFITGLTNTTESTAKLYKNLSGSLPVTLRYFNGRMTEPGALLGWATTREINNQGFRIERSRDALSFETIANVSGGAPASQLGNSATELTYSYLDPQPLPGTNYYRLVQTDLDGRRNLSKIIALAREGQLPVLFPNPVDASGVASLEPAVAYARYTLSDVQGRPVQQATSPGQLSRLSLAGLPPGVYMLHLETGSGQVQRFRVAKMN